MTDEQKEVNVEASVKAEGVPVESTEESKPDYSDQTLQGSDVEVDSAYNERRALADADGRKEYSEAELVQQDEDKSDYPYEDVRSLSDRPAGDVRSGTATDRATPVVADEGPTEAEAAAMRAAAEEQAAAVARRQALEAEEQSLKDEQKAITERKKAVREALGEAVEDDGDSEGWVK